MASKPGQLPDRVIQALQTAVALHQQGNLAEAERLYERVLDAAPNQFDALHLLGTLRIAQGRHGDGVTLIERALGINPNSARARLNLAFAFLSADKPGEALAHFDRALAHNPANTAVHYGRGRALNALDRAQEALAEIDLVLGREPHHVDALVQRGIALIKLRRHGEAIAAFDRVPRFGPAQTDALAGRALAYAALGRFEASLAECDLAVAIAPGSAEAHNNRGNALLLLRRYAEALACFDRALVLDPRSVRAACNRGEALAGLGRWDEAAKAFRQTLDAAPKHAEAWCGLGKAFARAGRRDEAWSAFGNALALKSDLADALYGRGSLLLERGLFGEAVAEFDRAIAASPLGAETWYGRATACLRLYRGEEALASFDKALALRPELELAAGGRLLVKMSICDWRSFDADCAELLSAVTERGTVVAPHIVLSISDEPHDQLAAARRYVAYACSHAAAPMWRGERYRHDRIRLAYLSPDFREHAVASLTAGLFEHHDKSRFETIGISFGLDDQSEMRRRIQAAFDRFIDVKDRADEDIAALVRDLEIDIAVDLAGHTQSSRTNIFAHRPAPIQVNYLGFPATMGADFIDYIIADRRVIPDHLRSAYAERVVQLPETFQPNDLMRPLPERVPMRREAGLPETGFIFCCFNQAMKISPTLFDVWMRLLHAVEGSIAWIQEGDPAVPRNLRGEAVRRGIAAERIVVAPRLGSHADHLARFGLADLFLDTFPYNAHTTASDALWVGVPVVTCAGSTFASRVAASVLHAIGLPELATHALEEYERLAGALATDAQRLAAIRTRLAANRISHPLFNIARFARHIEAAYETMWGRYQQGKPPESFAVAPIGS